MHMAAAEGHVDIMEILKNANARISAKDKRGRTPLHLAAYYGKVNAVEYLTKEIHHVRREQPYALVKHTLFSTSGLSYLDEAIKEGHRYGIKKKLVLSLQTYAYIFV